VRRSQTEVFVGAGRAEVRREPACAEAMGKVCCRETSRGTIRRHVIM